MDEITAALKDLRINYVPETSFPYERENAKDKKFDNVMDINPEVMIEIIDEWLQSIERKGIPMRLPRRTRPEDAVFVSSISRFVHSGTMKVVTDKTHGIVTSLLKIVKELLLVKDSSLCTPRKFYYLLKNDASCECRDHVTPDNVNECLIDLCCLFRCTRKSLKLNYATSSCLFGGCIEYEEIDINGKRRVTDCSGMLRSYQLHLDHIHSVKTPKSCPADFVLIVEKLAVLETLIEEKFCHKFPCVLVTGCGQPDVQCRMFVKMLHDTLRIPVCALVDFNAYGIEIMRSFKVGSFNLAHENYKLTVPSLKFVGLSGKDLQEYNIQISKLMDMPLKELGKANSLRDEKWVKNTEDVSDSLSCNIAWKKRADIEVLDIEKGFCFLANEYLPKKGNAVRVIEGSEKNKSSAALKQLLATSCFLFFLLRSSFAYINIFVFLVLFVYQMIMEHKFQPVIAFSISRRKCEQHALSMPTLDFNTEEEKDIVEQVFENSIHCLNEEERGLPAIESMLPFLRWGIAVQHSGLLPIIKELVELLFPACEGPICHRNCQLSLIVRNHVFCILVDDLLHMVQPSQDIQ
ncbi:DExH-box ATP-dependent RNA helicase DExH10 [Bienertia sinuspersici]